MPASQAPDFTELTKQELEEQLLREHCEHLQRFHEEMEHVRRLLCGDFHLPVASISGAELFGGDPDENQ